MSGTTTIDALPAASVISLSDELPIDQIGSPIVTRKTTVAQLLNAGNTSSLPLNRIHNGGFSINQRAYVSGTGLGAGVYAHDRWKAGAGGCTYTFVQGQPTTTINIAAGTLVQVVESVDVEGGTYTVTWLGSTTCRVNGGSYGPSPLTVTGLAANTNITLEFGGTLGTLGKVQMVAGAVQSPYQWRSVVNELALCQRFYEIGTLYWLLGSLGGAYALYTGAFKVTKRAAPTIATTNLTGGETPFAITSTIDSMYFQMTVTTLTELHCTWTASADL